MIKRAKQRMKSERERYPSEYNSWSGMKQRLAKRDERIHPKFASFEQFLEVMGPKPDPTFTLDRIKRDGPYAPGNVRWASKSLQSRNRGNTSILHYTGTTYGDYTNRKLSLSEWAEITKQNPSTMRGRKKAGWTHNEIIDGRRALRAKSFAEMSTAELLNFQPWTHGKEEAQEALYRNNQKRGEDRFEFMRRVIIPLQLEQLRAKHKRTAYYMHDEWERDKYEAQEGGFDKVVNDWGRKRGASESAWRDLQALYSVIVTRRRSIKAEHAAWLDALQIADARRLDTQSARRSANALRARYLTKLDPLDGLDLD